MENIQINASIVNVDSIKPFKANARKGNLGAIAESLKVNGQYRPIVVDIKTREILAGNHTWQAAKILGWTNIAVTFIEVDSQTAKRIVLADNRTSDLSFYDDEALLDILESFDSLEGTGFNVGDLDNLDGLFKEPKDNTETERVSTEEEKEKKTGSNSIVIAHYKIDIDPEFVETWQEIIYKGAGVKSKTISYLKTILAIPERIFESEEQSPEQVNVTKTDIVDISSVKPHPLNPRQGDIGAICESLKAFGQYRPIVVNKKDNVILVGNHTWFAARDLDWKHIAVTWVDVNEQAALRILVADNRTADLAAYDDEKLKQLLLSIDSFDGTGFDGDDIDSIIGGGEGTPLPKQVKFQLCDWSFKIDRATFQVWQSALPSDPHKACGKIASRLKLPNESWTAREMSY